MKGFTILLCVSLASCVANPIPSDSAQADSSSSLSQLLPLILQRVKEGLDPSTVDSSLSDFIGVVKNATDAAAKTKTGQLTASKLKTFTSKMMTTLGDATETTMSGLKKLQAFVKKGMKTVSSDVEHVLQVIGEGGKYLGNGTEEGQAGVLKYLKSLVADDVVQDDVEVVGSPVLGEADPLPGGLGKPDSGKSLDILASQEALGGSGGKGGSSGSEGDFDILKSLGKMGIPRYPWGGGSDSKGGMDLGGLLEGWGKMGDMLSPAALKNGIKTDFDLRSLLGGSKDGKSGSIGDVDLKGLLKKWGDIGALKNGSKTGFDLRALFGGSKDGNISGSKAGMDFKSLLGKWGEMGGIAIPEGKGNSSGSKGDFDFSSLVGGLGGMGGLPSFGDTTSGGLFGGRGGSGDPAASKVGSGSGSAGGLGTLVKNLKGMWGKSDQTSGPKSDFEFGDISKGIEKISNFNENLLSKIFKSG